MCLKRGVIMKWIFSFKRVTSLSINAIACKYWIENTSSFSHSHLKNKTFWIWIKTSWVSTPLKIQAVVSRFLSSISVLIMFHSFTFAIEEWFVELYDLKYVKFVNLALLTLYIWNKFLVWGKPKFKHVRVNHNMLILYKP